MEYSAKTWRVRSWIQVLTVLLSFGWLALVWFLGLRSDVDVWSELAFLSFSAVPPFLAMRPVVKIRSDGELLLRGWTSQRRANAGQIRQLAMNQFGLQMTFDDGTSFTTVIFQATRSFGRPRVLEFADALRQDPGASKSFDPLELFHKRNIEIYRRTDIDDRTRRGGVPSQLGFRVVDLDEPNGLLSRLVGDRMYSVEFVLNDYVQFNFDGFREAATSVTLNSYVWPVVEFGGRTWRESDLGYADAIRQLTPGTVVAATEQTGHGIKIELDTGVLVINPSFEEVYVEIAEIMGWDDRAWMVWRAGEDSFEHIREP